MDVLDKTKEPLFVCIGTKGSFYDNTSNRIGKKLKKCGFDVILEVDNVTIKKKLKELKGYNKDIYQIIAIDLSYESNYDYTLKTTHKYSNTGIKPGGALGRNYKAIGDASIKIYLQAFEEVKNKVDLLLSICRVDGNTEIYATEEQIVEELKKYYNK